MSSADSSADAEIVSWFATPIVSASIPNSEQLTRELKQYTAAWYELLAADVLEPEDDLDGRPGIARERIASRALDPALLEIVDRLESVSESDLFLMDVEPTMSGLLKFIEIEGEGIVGFCDRIFDHEKGNIILLESKIRDPSPGISTIEFKILSSLQQRGLYLQKSMKYAGLQLYTIIKAEVLNDNLLSFLKAIGIDWEIIFLRRDLAHCIFSERSDAAGKCEQMRG